MTQATAAANEQQSENPTRAKKTTQKRDDRRPPTLDARLAAKLAAVRKHRGTVRFFENRPWLLRSKRHGAAARASKRRAEKHLARAQRDVRKLRRKIRLREERRLRKLPPKAAICTVFESHCREAISVAWCESRLDPNARNGQYLGLFQMGSYARTLFGHGPTPHDQAEAAHAYFVRSGKDWSPWSCKPGRAYYE